MQSLIVIIHALGALALIGLILIQHGKGADAGAAFGSGGSSTVFGARGPTSFLTRTTAILATLFFITSLGLAYLSGRSTEGKSVTEQTNITSSVEKPSAEPKEQSDVPGIETKAESKSLFEEKQ